MHLPEEDGRMHCTSSWWWKGVHSRFSLRGTWWSETVMAEHSLKSVDPMIIWSLES